MARVKRTSRSAKDLIGRKRRVSSRINSPAKPEGARTLTKRLQQKATAQSPKQTQKRSAHRAKRDSSLFEVQQLVDKRIHLGKVQYKVRWRGYSESESTWEPVTNLKNVQKLLDKFDAQQEKQSQKQAPPPQLSSFYFVDDIVGRRERKGKPEYMVKWKGYDQSENTWEPVAHLQRAMDLVESFNKQNASAQSRKS